MASSDDGFANSVNVRLGLWEKTRDLNVDSKEIEDFESWTLGRDKIHSELIPLRKITSPTPR